ncbi:palmitoyl-acyl carrier protein thioesterase [Pyrus ussuriensis x Pyrus communis]|uniref:Acyl-[acyl-carrier-protein] hydrolase n=1 Tax=Pyrus ussuriensis x Pyrus communis TaxID=2448454 RepID=A0A5N5H7D2_9ROSA|nr:palmitoyl-acyl carrier protein thioesterase [Pyrus ussuriensis x Pyrus communis]
MLLLPTKQLTFPSKNKSTLCREGTNNGSHTNQSNPNFTPAAKVHAKVFPKGNVIVASKEEDDKTAGPASPTKKMPQHPNMESAKYDGVYDMFRGRLDESGFVFQQNFAIRSYELGPNGKATMTCLMELQHCGSIGLFVGGFGSSLEISKRGQVWVVRKLQVVVDKYPSRADVIQVDSWSGASGNNGMFRDWIFRDYITGEILMRAKGLYVLMNIKTRKVGRLTEEIKQEFKPYFVDSDPLIDINSTKLGRLNVDGRDYVQTGLANQLLMKNHQARPTASNVMPEAHSTYYSSYKQRKNRHGRGNGQQAQPWAQGQQSAVPKGKIATQHCPPLAPKIPNFKNKGKALVQAASPELDMCYCCGSSDHWSCVC